MQQHRDKCTSSKIAVTVVKQLTLRSNLSLCNWSASDAVVIFFSPGFSGSGDGSISGTSSRTNFGCHRVNFSTATFNVIFNFFRNSCGQERTCDKRKGKTLTENQIIPTSLWKLNTQSHFLLHFKCYSCCFIFYFLNRLLILASEIKVTEFFQHSLTMNWIFKILLLDHITKCEPLSDQQVSEIILLIQKTKA